LPGRLLSSPRRPDWDRARRAFETWQRKLKRDLEISLGLAAGASVAAARRAALRARGVRAGVCHTGWVSLDWVRSVVWSVAKLVSRLATRVMGLRLYGGSGVCSDDQLGMCHAFWNVCQLVLSASESEGISFIGMIRDYHLGLRR